MKSSQGKSAGKSDRQKKYGTQAIMTIFYIASREEAERQAMTADEFIRMAGEYCIKIWRMHRIRNKSDDIKYIRDVPAGI